MEDVINLIRTRMGLASKERRFPKKGTLAEIISMARNKGAHVEQELEEDSATCGTVANGPASLAAAYDAYKRERGLLDYDDLLYRIVELMEQHEGIRRQLSNTYRYIMVDEYQDTNAIQAQIGAAARRDPSQCDGGGRRRAVDLFFPRRELPQHHGLSRSSFPGPRSSSWRRTTAPCRGSWTCPTR